jgi:hypothetical protein
VALALHAAHGLGMRSHDPILVLDLSTQPLPYKALVDAFDAEIQQLILGPELLRDIATPALDQDAFQAAIGCYKRAAQARHLKLLEHVGRTLMQDVAIGMGGWPQPRRLRRAAAKFARGAYGTKRKRRKARARLDRNRAAWERSSMPTIVWDVKVRQ